jgi:hypothetical protein
VYGVQKTQQQFKKENENYKMGFSLFWGGLRLIYNG